MPTFERRVILRRFVHADDADAARISAHQGVHIATGFVAQPYTITEAVEVERTTVCPYLHAGESDHLWQVSIEVRAQLCTADAVSASEAAHQLITVDDTAARSDAFEFEIDPATRGEHLLRSAC